MFTSLNFIYRANEGSPTPKTGQSPLNTEAAHPSPPANHAKPQGLSEGLCSLQVVTGILSLLRGCLTGIRWSPLHLQPSS